MTSSKADYKHIKVIKCMLTLETTAFGLFIERFSYDLEMKTRKQNRKKQTNGNRAI